MILPSLLGPVDDDAPRVLSVCSGVGGKDLGFHRGGFRTVGLCEFDPWRRRVLARHWPGIPIHEDLEALADWAEQDPEAVREWLGGQPAVLIGGTPCQDLSSAGRRAGLAGERSGLFFAFMRLRHALGIEWTVWENVRGALTSNGGVDFMAVVGAFVGATLTVPAAGIGGAGVAAGPRGGCVWRLLNAQWFGVPQRRRRVFVVGRLGGECPPAVLLERVGGRRHSQEGGAAGPVPPWATAVRARGAGGPGLADRNGGGGRGDDDGAGPVGRGAKPVQFLTTRFGSTGADAADAEAGWLVGDREAAGREPERVEGRRGDGDVCVAGTVTRRYGKGPDSDGGYGQLVAPTLAKQGVGTGQFLGSDAGIIAATLTGGGHPGSAPPGRRREDDVNIVAAEAVGNGLDAERGAAGGGPKFGTAGGQQPRDSVAADGVSAGGGGSAEGAPDGVSAGGGEPGRSEGRRAIAAAGKGGSAADDVAGGVAPVDADGVRAVDGMAGRVDGDVEVFTERTRGGAYLPERSELVPALKGSTGVGGGGRQTFVKRRGAGAGDASPETVTADSHRQDTPPALVTGTLRAAMPSGGSAGDDANALAVARATIPISSDAAAGRSGAASPGVNAPSLGVGNEGDPSFAVNASGPPSVFVSGAADIGSCAVDPLPDGRRYAACGDGVAAPQAHWIALRLRSVMEGKDPDGNA